MVVTAVVGLLRHVLGWRIWIRRPERVPGRDQPLVVAFNHTSAVDAFLVADTVWRRLRHWCRPLAKAELFEVPVLRTLARHAGAIPVARAEGAGREAAYDAAVARLSEGATILVAPEGTITHDGSLLPLRHGAARLALEAGADVLIVTHFGAQRGFSPVVRFPDRGVVVTMALDVLTPWPDEDASSLTGRIAATMLDRSAELQATYPQADPAARWWPPYSRPASPTAIARENLEHYQESMAEAVAHARERMTEIADQTRHRVEEIADQTRHRVEEIAAQAREQASSLGDRLPIGESEPVPPPGEDEPEQAGAVGTDEHDPP